ncbi:MAG: hypothetical protein J0M04_08760 [Verrucomicrobia bacterium]|nr:hypothetical protein [Verrucomicrobiota bacterium]
MSEIAGALDVGMLGWQELVVAGLPLRPEEIVTLRNVIAGQNGPAAARTVAALDMKLGNFERSLEILKPVVDPEQPARIRLWQCQLAYLLGRESEATEFLEQADVSIIPSGAAYQRAEFLAALTRVAHGMDILARHRPWLEWLATKEDHPDIQWEAVGELIDLAYHEGRSFNVDLLPRWLRPALPLANGKLDEAYTDLQSGKDTWWKSLTVRQHAVLVRNLPRSRALVHALAARLATANDDDRIRSLGALLGCHCDPHSLHRVFMKDRALYRACLPGMFRLMDSGLISYPFAEVAAQEAIARPTDLAVVAMAMRIRALPRDLQPQILAKAWRSIEPSALSAIPGIGEHPYRSASPAARLAVQLAANCRSIGDFRTLIASHPQSAAFPARVVEVLEKRINNGAGARPPTRVPPADDGRMTAFRRVLQDFTSPDIARRRVPLSGVLTKSPDFPGWHYTQPNDWIWAIPSPLRAEGPCAGRMRPDNDDALALRKQLGSRLAPASPLAGQLFLSSAIISVREERLSESDPRDFKPSPEYPAATRALMRLQCAELFPKPAESGLRLMKQVLSELPVLARSFQPLIGESRCFGNDTPANEPLAEAINRMNDAESAIIAKLSPQPDLSDQERVFELLARPQTHPLGWGRNSYPSNLRQLLLQPDLATNLAKLRDLHAANGHDPEGIERSLLDILTAVELDDSEPCIGIARKMADASPGNIAAVNILLSDAMTRGDRETITVRFAAAMGTGFSNLVHLHSAALDCLHPEDFIRILTATEDSPDIAPFAQSVGSSSNGVPRLLQAVNFRAPALLDRAFESLRPRMTDYDRAAYSLEWFHLARNLARPESPKPTPTLAAIPEIEPKHWNIPFDVEQAWGLAEQSGHGVKVTAILEDAIAKRPTAEGTRPFHVQTAVAARHASDATWKLVLADDQSQGYSAELDALTAAECYHDGCPQRALEWLESISSRITGPGTQFGNGRYPDGIAAADGLARAYLWIDRPDQAEACVRRFPELSRAPEWQPFLRRKAPLNESLSVRCSLAAAAGRKSVLHWVVCDDNASGEGLWSPLTLEGGLTARVAVFSAGVATRTIPVDLHGTSSGTVDLGEIRDGNVVKFELQDRDKSRIWRGATSATPDSSQRPGTIDETEELLPSIIQAAREAGMNATMEDGVSHGHGPHLFLRGWLPPGGLEIRSWPCEGGTSASLHATTAQLTERHGFFITTMPQDRVAAVNAQRLWVSSGGSRSLAWFTPDQPRFLPLPAVAGNRWILKFGRGDTDLPSFVCIRIAMPKLTLRRTVPPAGAIHLGYFPANDHGKVIMDPERGLAVCLSRCGPAVFSHTLDPASFARIHRLAYNGPVAGAFTRDAFVLIDGQGYLWKASLDDFVFRIVGHFPHKVVTILSGNATSRAAMLCDDGTVSLIDTAACPLKPLATVKLAANERCWLSPDGGVLAIRADEGRKVRCLDAATGQAMPVLDFSTIAPSCRVLRFQNSEGGGWEDREGRPWPGTFLSAANRGEDTPLGGMVHYPGQFHAKEDGKALFMVDPAGRLLRIAVPDRPGRKLPNTSDHSPH